MKSLNPYSAPKPEQPLATHAPLFEHRVSTRTFSMFVACLAMLLLTFYCGRIAALFCATPLTPTWVKLMVGAAAACVALGTGFFHLLFAFPRVFQFDVDREFVSWSISWPTTHMKLPVSSVQQITLAGSAISIVTARGEVHHPDVRTYGGQAEEVADAINAVIQPPKATAAN